MLQVIAWIAFGSIPETWRDDTQAMGWKRVSTLFSNISFYCDEGFSYGFDDFMLEFYSERDDFFIRYSDLEILDKYIKETQLRLVCQNDDELGEKFEIELEKARKQYAIDAISGLSKDIEEILRKIDFVSWSDLELSIKASEKIRGELISECVECFNFCSWKLITLLSKRELPVYGISKSDFDCLRNSDETPENYSTHEYFSGFYKLEFSDFMLHKFNLIEGSYNASNYPRSDEPKCRFETIPKPDIYTNLHVRTEDMVKFVPRLYWSQNEKPSINVKRHTSASENAAKKKFFQYMSENPHTQIKKNDAKQLFGDDISVRGFNRVWDEVSEQYPHLSKAGRKSKRRIETPN